MTRFKKFRTKIAKTFGFGKNKNYSKPSPNDIIKKLKIFVNSNVVFVITIIKGRYRTISKYVRKGKK
jgi:hypothetical protein